MQTSMLTFHSLLLALIFGSTRLVKSTNATPKPDHFIYSRVPEDLLDDARAIGEFERANFQKEAAKVGGDSDKIMQLYAQHLMVCSSVGAKLTNHLEQSIGEKAKAPAADSDEARAQQILRTFGFDDVSARLFTLPADEIQTVVKTACLKHELQFQCAFGFVADEAKIRRNIDEMKNDDGNVKIMFEQECSASGEKPDDRPIPKIYSCIGGAAQEIHAACSSALAVYNRTRHLTNIRIHALYHSTLEELAENLDIDQMTEAEGAQTAKLGSMLKEIRQVEAFRCIVQARFERCSLDVVTDQCGEKAHKIAETILHTGQLRRERGDHLHEHFLEFSIDAHPKCARYV